jgi:hypothetical protein
MIICFSRIAALLAASRLLGHQLSICHDERGRDILHSARAYLLGQADRLVGDGWHYGARS